MVDVVGAVVDVVDVDVDVVLVDDVVVDSAGGGAVVVVDSGGAGADDGGVPSGAGVLNGTGALGPPSTYTGVPLATVLENQSDADIGIRTQPCDAGDAGTDGAP